ncbi:MAG: hypothetical protein QW085_00410 [Pyrobaculum sp.]
MLEVKLSPNRVLYVEDNKIQLGESRYTGLVEIKRDGLYIDRRLVVFRRALKCPVKIGGVYLCGGPRELPRFFYREAFVEGLGEELRVSELYATTALNEGNCLAEYLYALIKGGPHLWDIYYGKSPRAPRRCRDIINIQISRGERQKKVFKPPTFSKEIAALLGLVKFSEAIELIEKNWLGFAIALRYGIYSALKWRLNYNRDSWLLLFGLYSALDPVVLPGGVAIDLGILRATPYLVVRLMGRWLVAMNVAGLYLSVGNINMMTDGGRKRDIYASCEDVKCVVGNFLFNICKEISCGIVRTWDFEFKSLVKCKDYGSPFFAIEPCQ